MGEKKRPTASEIKDALAKFQALQMSARMMELDKDVRSWYRAGMGFHSIAAELIKRFVIFRDAGVSLTISYCKNTIWSKQP